MPKVEEWRLIPGYEQHYEVSSLGRVRRIGSSRICRGSLQHTGYIHIQLSHGSHETRQMHTLQSVVASAFLGPRPPGKVVNHIDHNKTNNDVTNLEYVTQRENLEESYKRGLKRRGECHGMARLTDDLVRQLRAEYRRGDPEHCAAALGKRFGIPQGTVADVVYGKAWRHVT